MSVFSYNVVVTGSDVDIRVTNPWNIAVWAINSVKCTANKSLSDCGLMLSGRLLCFEGTCSLDVPRWKVITLFELFVMPFILGGHGRGMGGFENCSFSFGFSCFMFSHPCFSWSCFSPFPLPCLWLATFPAPKSHPHRYHFIMNSVLCVNQKTILLDCELCALC